MRVLLVEDDALFLQFMVASAIGARHDVQFCGGENRAYAKAKAEAFDVIVTDYDLEGQGQGCGASLIRRLKVDGVPARMALMSSSPLPAREYAERLGVRFIEKRRDGFFEELLAFIAAS